MPGVGPKFYNCVVCSKRTKPKERRIINKEVRKYLVNKLFVSVNEHDIICNKCKHKYYLAETTKNVSNIAETVDPDYVPPSRLARNPAASPPSIHLSIQSTPKTHSRCLICKKPGPKLIVISSEARFQAFLQHNILISAGSRCCPVHMNEENLKQECLVNIKFVDETFINRTGILNLLNQLRDMCVTKQGNIDFDNIDDVDCKNLTSLSRAQFEDLFSHVSDKIKNTPSRSQRTTVGLFLLKLRSGLSNKLLATLFRISRSSIRRGIVAVTKAMMRSFVPLYLGLESKTREDIIQNHTRPLAKSIFQAGDDDLILVLDGTYVYIQKSNNFKFQRRTYSLHKGRPLVKPMVVVSTTGYFVTVVGPYFADSKNNDAAILNHMLKTNIDDIKSFLKQDDILVVDRGFMDSISLLEDLGLRAEMPAITAHGKKQMSTEDANSSRLVTKIRWVVESANSRIKSWKYLDHVLPTNQIPLIGDYVRIVCAIGNKYSPPLSAPVNLESDLQLAEMMRRRSSELNTLKSFIEDNGLERKVVVWKSVDQCDLQHFPRLTEDQLRSLTCGVYQLKLSSSYIKEHLDGDSDIHVHKDDENLIRVKIQSRHISSKKYILWIRFTQVEVIGWYCKCKAGSRVVGVCSHIASIIWYLSYARHTENMHYGVRDWGLRLSDAADIPEPVDMSDTCSESSIVEE